MFVLNETAPLILSTAMSEVTVNNEQGPFRSIAGVVESAVQAARDGAADAREAAGKALPAAGQFLSRALYTTCYTMSYGVVFPSVLLARSIPRDNAVVHGLIDGAHAAVEMVNGWKSRPGPAPAPTDGVISAPPPGT